MQPAAKIHEARESAENRMGLPAWMSTAMARTWKPLNFLKG